IGSSIEQAKQAMDKAKTSGPGGKVDEEALKAATQQLADANSRLSQETEGVLQQMIELRPDLAGTAKGMEALQKEAGKVAAELSGGDLAKAQEIMGAAVAGNEKGGKLSKTEAEAIARIKVSKETGVDSGLLRRQFGQGGASAKMAQQQQFIQSREGQRFGRLAEFAPELTEGFSKTKIGGALGKAADFTQGKGGKFSKAFAGAGGFQGIGASVAVGTESIKQFLPKSALKDPNTAGALGAVSGGAVGMAAGAELGTQLAGPIGGIIGAAGGAIVGGIKGFFDAKNMAILTNALEKLTGSSEKLDVAFKELEKNDTDKNFKNVQKAFGDVISSSKELDAIAFSGAEGPSAMGIGGGALAGAAIGALAGSFIPVIGTAIGAAVGGVLGGATAFMVEGQNKANQQEALQARVGSSGKNVEGATRMAERQMKGMSTEELDNLIASGKNIIAEQYKESAIAAAEAANGEATLSEKKKESIAQGALEVAYLDAYMKQRKEAGATDEKISEDILKDRKTALEAGRQALDTAKEAAEKQQLLARATKELAVETENLLDIYRRTAANAQRFTDEVGDMMDALGSRNDTLGGQGSNNKVSRTNERILGNMSSYSTDEVKAATQNVVNKLGNTPEAQQLGQQAQAAKFVQDKLPGMLRNLGEGSTGDERSGVVNQLKDQMAQTMGVDVNSGPFKQMFEEIAKEIEGNKSTGTLATEISTGGIEQFSKTTEEARKTLEMLAKTYNDTLQKSTELQNQYNQTIMKANEYARKAGSIRINAELDLSKALGNSPTLAQLNEPLDFEIKDLTKGLTPGGTTDPTAIAAGIMEKEKQKTDLEAQKKQLVDTGGAGVQSLSKYQELDAAIGDNIVSINEGRQALEKLANDGSKAANALAKIEEQQRQIEGLGNTFEKILTSGPEELFKQQMNSNALQQAQQGGPEFMKSLKNRQMAFAGLEQDKEFLKPEEYRKQRAGLIRKGLEAQGLTGQSKINKGGIEMTVDDFIKRLEGGVSEEDPNVKAYREAVQTQIDANQKLADLELQQSENIQIAMLGLQDFLATKFPEILSKAVTDSKTDAATKPEKESKPKTESQKKADEAGKKVNEKKAEVDDIDRKIAAQTKKIDEYDKMAASESGPAKATAQEGARLARKERDKLKNQKVAKGKEYKDASEEYTLAQSEIEQANNTAMERIAANTKPSTTTTSSDQGTNLPLGSKYELPPEMQQRLDQIKAERAARAASKTTQTTSSVTQAPPAPGTSVETPGGAVATSEALPIDPTVSGYYEAKGQAEIQKKMKQLENAKKIGKRQGKVGKKGKTDEFIAKKEAELQQLQDFYGVKPEETIPAPSAPGTPQANAGVQRAAAQAARGETTNTPSSVAAATARVTSGPVPVTKPQTPTTTSASSAEADNKAMTAGTVVIDPKSLEGLATFNTTFGSYVDKLVNFTFPTIPDKIELNHTVKVDMTGAASIQALEKHLQELAMKLVQPKIDELRNQTSSATKGAVPPSR
ncbi:hypothetical protein EB001_13620, partial [bacterium]|nr:hypothetical protein [bacterium]